MKPADLQEEIAVELEAMEITVNELRALERDLAEREPTIRENTAAAAFLAQFYNGLENILKRISHFHGFPYQPVKPGTSSFFSVFLTRPTLVYPSYSIRSWPLRWHHIDAFGMLPFIATVFNLNGPA